MPWPKRSAFRFVSVKRKRNLPAYEAVKERSQGVCERCKSKPASEVHHRRLKKQGGADSERNLIALCTFCHRWAHANVAEACAEMLIISPKYHGFEVAREYEQA